LSKRLATAVFLFGSAALPSAAEVRTGTFTSASLGRDVGYAVDLPASYDSGGRRYPVLYALHGLFEGSAFWERRGLAPLLRELQTKGEFPEALVVTVDGGNSFFVNSPLGRYEDLVTKDLIAHVEGTYRVQAGPGGRALLGISMGGYAALRIGLAQPGLFKVVATHSAMLFEAIPSGEGLGQWRNAAGHKVFGDPVDPALWTSSDPLAWAEKVDPKSAPALYFDCGSEDRLGFFAGNNELDRRLTARKIPHEFALYPGNHGYEYVRSVLEKSLRFIARNLNPESGTPKSGSAPKKGGQE
jgi:S-formylglutathione hydrolase FrmB